MVPFTSHPAATTPGAQSTPVPDDAALIAAARADPEAFGLVYERYVGVIYRYCYLRLGNATAAEDATSEVFLKALGGLPGFRNGNVAAWMLRIARNVVVDHHRRGRRATSLDQVEELADPRRTPEGDALARAEAEALRAAMNALPEDQRTTLTLQLAGWSGDQIAAALGKKPSAVYMLRARALVRMQKTLRRAGWNPGGTCHGEA
jgi:RNA polymerase sigma-70 factor (ECF subfamily)